MTPLFQEWFCEVGFSQCSANSLRGISLLDESSVEAAWANASGEARTEELLKKINDWIP